jgi:uncharacterized membrane-anchored protein
MGTFARALALLFVAFAAAADPPLQQPQAPPQLAWKRGPGKIPIGSVAEIELGDHFVALDAAGTRKFLELNQNPTEGNEVAVVAPATDGESWFLLFQYDEIGYVRDDERNDLDAAAMLDSIRDGTKKANEERKKRGWATMDIVGWKEAPHYDAATNNLTWAIVGRSGEGPVGGETINKLVKLLGRKGVMTATLVTPPGQFAAATTTTDQLLGAYTFKKGNTYAEFVEGHDSVAEIGLKGLILGGAGAALIKSGLLGKLWKLIVAGGVALSAGVRRLFGRSDKATS